MKRISTVYFAIAWATLALMSSSVFASENASQVSASPFAFFEVLVQKQPKDPWSRHDLIAHRDIRATVLNLLDYVYDNIRNYRTDLNDPNIPRYNRSEHFGGWVRPEQGSCFNTRSWVLVRDAVLGAKISFKNNGCVVVKGRWHDPYTDHEYKMANSMQVDHVVPLKHAYYAGAHRWSAARRCHYANYRSDRSHLLAVSAHENMSKSDKSPDRYMPPNSKFACRYLNVWLRIKAVWELSLSAEEANAVHALARENGCSGADFHVPEDELVQERERAREPISKCVNFGSSNLPLGEDEGSNPQTIENDPHDSWAHEHFPAAG